MLNIEKINYNDIEELISNTYIIRNDIDCIVVDPGAANDSVIRFLNKRELSLKAVLLTHGHIDHIRGVDPLVEQFNCKVYIHPDDERMLTDTFLNCSEMLGESLIVRSNASLVNDNDVLKILKDDDIKVIHTPFHTKGSVCYYFINNKWLFSGDTLFKNSIGRDDLPNSDSKRTNDSLNKIKALPRETKIYPGHGNNTTLESELMLNHFLIK